MKSNYNYNKNLKPNAQSLRKNATRSEIVLWKHILSKGQLNGFKFKRQRTIGKYIVDFFCPELNLIIELDGMSHLNKDIYDERRQKELEELGYKFLRFYDDYILNNLEDCKIYLFNYIEKMSSPNPLQRGQNLN